ncbi:MAG: lytic transglycosylase [Terriglobia bacterium]|nr:MAG: lytic transglycosylase [Terriglobia bacterium]
MSLFAGEYAVLASGSRLHIDHHEIGGAKVKLYTGDGTIEMKASDIAGFEVEEYAPKQAAPAPPMNAPNPGELTTPPATSPQQLADAAAEKYGLPRSLVRSVMKTESAFRPQAVSPKGAIGLMQLMPATAQTLGADPHDPAQNVDAGTRYLRELLEKYAGGLRHALAAYNAGPGAVDKFHGVPPYPETIDYVRKIERDWKPASTD